MAQVVTATAERAAVATGVGMVVAATEEATEEAVRVAEMAAVVTEVARVEAEKVEVMVEAVRVEAMVAAVTVVERAEGAMVAAMAVEAKAAVMAALRSPRQRSSVPHASRSSARICSPLRILHLQRRVSPLWSVPAHTCIASR